MKFFIDTANVDEIKAAVALGVADGVTTNPTLLAREDGEPEEIYRQICELVDGPVCAEAVSQESKAIVRESQVLSAIHPNIVVKIPATREGLIAVNILEKRGIRTNVTLIFSPMQALLAAKAGAAYVCPFVGRLDDASHAGMDLIEEILIVLGQYDFPTRVVVASVRHPLHVKEAALLGADIVTMPLKVIEQLIQHPLTDAGVASFMRDWGQVRARSRKKKK